MEVADSACRPIPDSVIRAAFQQLSISGYVITVVSRLSAHGHSYFNVDFHPTGRLPCVLGV